VVLPAQWSAHFYDVIRIVPCARKTPVLGSCIFILNFVYVKSLKFKFDMISNHYNDKMIYGVNLLKFCTCSTGRDRVKCEL